MRTNLPVSHKEYFFPESQLLVSTTDARGHITHCNTAFAEVSGYSYDELMGGRGVTRLAQGHAKPGTAHAGHGARGAHLKAA